jgi:hypothetical protein
MERIAWLEILSCFVASDLPELEAFARASMRGLRHKVGHKIGQREQRGAEQVCLAMQDGDQYRVAFSAFCPTMMRPTSGLSD